MLKTKWPMPVPPSKFLEGRNGIEGVIFENKFLFDVLVSSL